MRRRGNTLLVGIADELNRRGIPAPRGGQWSATQVARVL
ncbi:recombinase family protein [Methylobacterium iners]